MAPISCISNVFKNQINIMYNRGPPYRTSLLGERIQKLKKKVHAEKYRKAMTYFKCSISKKKGKSP